jgi:4-hydroxy-3-methylbut-2-enyl diphosphate reductase
MAVAPAAVRLVETEADVEAMEPPDGPVAFLAQTTLALDDWKDVLAAADERFSGLWVPGRSDLCFATTNRQSALKSIAGRSDAVVVVGSANSSNTVALERTARSAGCTRVLRINGPDELPDDLAGVVGLTAGASAPEELVQAVIDRLDPSEGVEEVTVTHEDEYFPLPRELRELLRAVSAAAALSLFAPVEGKAGVPDGRHLPAGDVLDALTG